MYGVFTMMDRRGLAIALFSAWASLASPAEPHRNMTATPEVSVQSPFTIDLQAHPHAQFRIDAFNVPAASRAEFQAAMHRSLAFLHTLPGFLHHMDFEKVNGPTEFNLVTIAVWASRDAISAAAAKVRSYYQSIGFDVQATLGRLGITASLGYYTAPLPSNSPSAARATTRSTG